jgi:hypothetical protein
MANSRRNDKLLFIGGWLAKKKAVSTARRLSRLPLQQLSKLYKPATLRNVGAVGITIEQVTKQPATDCNTAAIAESLEVGSQFGKVLMQVI